MTENRNNLIPPLDAVPAELRDLVDGYVADALDAGRMDRLEELLRADPAARRFFARYARLDRGLHLEAHARRQGEAALARIGMAGGVDDGAADVHSAAAVAGAADSGDRPSGRRLRPHPLRGLAAAAAIAAAVGTGWMLARSQAPPSARPIVAVPTRPADPAQTKPAAGAPEIAWLVNAQNCRWADGDAPAEMRAGTLLAVDRGLAELRFRSGAAVILEGPARLELLSGNSARLHRGRLTGKVDGPVKGFELFSPGGRVVDLGTEFGVVVADSGETDVYVFDGHVRAAGGDARVVDLTGAQSARLEAAGGVVVRPAAADGVGGVGAGPGDFVRGIVPPPVIEPCTMRVNFGKGYDGTVADASGVGTGLTHRLPGTGGDLPAGDPNLVVNAADGQLELTTTRSDINGRRDLGTGEYLGIRLAELGFTGPEDFEVQMVVPNIPALQRIGQFGLYAGARSDRVIRGGLLSRGDDGQADEGRYTLFMTNNDGGRDADSHFIGLFATGDDVRVRLKRTNGKYALTVENLGTGAASTLTIRHPAYLDPENDLYVGLFGANTSSEVRRTLLIKEFAVTVWTRDAGERKATLADAR